MTYDKRDRIEALRRKITGLEALASDRAAAGPEADSARANAERLRAELEKLSEAAPRPRARPFAGRTHRATSPGPEPPRRSTSGATASPARARWEQSSINEFVDLLINGIGVIFLLLVGYVLPQNRAVQKRVTEDPLAWLNEQPQPQPVGDYQPAAPSRTPMSEVCAKRIPAGYVAVHDSVEKEWFLVPLSKRSSYQEPRYTSTREEFWQRMQKFPCPW